MEILDSHVIPYSEFVGENFNPIQDNAQLNLAAQVKQY